MVGVPEKERSENLALLAQRMLRSAPSKVGKPTRPVCSQSFRNTQICLPFTLKSLPTDTMEACCLRQPPATLNGSEYNAFYSSRPSATPATKYFDLPSSSSTCPSPSSISTSSFSPPLWLNHLRDVLSRQADSPSRSRPSSSLSTLRNRGTETTSLSSCRRFDRKHSISASSPQTYQYTIQ